MGRRGLCVLVAVWMAVSLGRPASAAVKTGSITVEWGQPDGSVTLFKVGTPVSGGFMLMQEFGGGVVTEKDVASQALAQWLCEQVEYEGWTLPADDRGMADYQRLEEGLYLIVQNGAAEGYYPFVPFLVKLPSEGQWNVLAKPKMQQAPGESPRTGQDMAPYIGSAGMGISAAVLILLVKKRKLR